MARKVVRRRRRAPVQGAGLLGDLWKGVKSVAGDVHDYVKKNKLISNALKDVGFSKTSNVVSALGYGRAEAGKRKRKGGGVQLGVTGSTRMG